MLPKAVTVAWLALLGVSVARRIQEQVAEDGGGYMHKALEGMDAGVSQEPAELATNEADASNAEASEEQVELGTNEVSQEQIDLAVKRFPFEVSQEQINLAAKRAQMMMADADFRDQLQAFEGQVNTDPDLQKQLEVYEEALIANPNLRKKLELVKKTIEATEGQQPSPASLIEVSENSASSWSMWQALATLLLASDGTYAFQLPGRVPGGRVATGPKPKHESLKDYLAHRNAPSPGSRSAQAEEEERLQTLHELLHATRAHPANSRAGTPQMMAAVGEAPNVKVGDMVPDVSLDSGFPPEKQIPGYLAKEAELKAKGISDVITYCVNDGAVMKAWAADQKVGSSIVKMFGDPRSELTEALGLVLDHPGPMSVLGNSRCKRFSMFIDDGVIKNINVAEAEDDPAGDDDPSASLVEQILKQIPDQMSPDDLS